MGLSEWGRQTSEQAVERETGKGTRISSVVKWGRGPQRCVALSRHLVASAMMAACCNSTSEAAASAGLGKGSMLRACFLLPSKLSSVWLVQLWN